MNKPSIWDILDSLEEASLGSDHAVASQVDRRNFTPHRPLSPEPEGDTWINPDSHLGATE